MFDAVNVAVASFVNVAFPIKSLTTAVDDVALSLAAFIIVVSNCKVLD